jgi:3-mercaptopyruvate sulfurtransferase SseA
MSTGRIKGAQNAHWRDFWKEPRGLSPGQHDDDDDDDDGDDDDEQFQVQLVLTEYQMREQNTLR